MRPARRKQIVAKTASEMELPAELVDEIVSYLYTTVQNMLSSGDYHAIQVPNLGQFVIKPKSLVKKIEHTENKIPYLEKIDAMHIYEIRMERIEDLRKMRILQERMAEEKERKRKIYESRNLNNHEKYINPNLEEQREDC